MQGFLDIILHPGITAIQFSARGFQLFKPLGARINVFYDADKTQKAFAVTEYVQYYSVQNVNVSGILYFENASTEPISVTINLL